MYLIDALDRRDTRHFLVKRLTVDGTVVNGDLARLIHPGEGVLHPVGIVTVL